ncbi:hypothetical protein HQ447_03385 [bacterium]|nr:hypothetical protein [bacterium]
MTIISALANLVCITSCGAAVIQNDALIGTPTTPLYYFPFEHTFTVTSAPHILIEIAYGTRDDFTFQSQGLSSAYSLFLVNLDINFNATFVNSQTSFVNNWNSPGTNILELSPGQSEYIGYWRQGFGPPRLTAGDSDIFGWALLTNLDGTLVVSSSATANGGGIKIGTMQQIPEPRTVLICATGAVLGCIRKRRTIRG